MLDSMQYETGGGGALAGPSPVPLRPHADTSILQLGPWGAFREEEVGTVSTVEWSVVRRQSHRGRPGGEEGKALFVFGVKQVQEFMPSDAHSCRFAAFVPAAGDRPALALELFGVPPERRGLFGTIIDPAEVHSLLDARYLVLVAADRPDWLAEGKDGMIVSDGSGSLVVDLWEPSVSAELHRECFKLALFLRLADL